MSLSPTMNLPTAFEFWDRLPPELQIEILSYCFTSDGVIYLEYHDIFVPLLGTEDFLSFWDDVIPV
jgi:hypothetical protein